MYSKAWYMYSKAWYMYTKAWNIKYIVGKQDFSRVKTAYSTA